MSYSPATLATHWTPRRSALLGAVLWLIWIVVASPIRTPLVTVFAPFVIVPLGLGIAARAHTGPTTNLLARLVPLAPVFAISAAVSFVPTEGALAAALALPWLGFTIVLATIGVGRVMSRRTLLDPGIGVDAGLIYVLVGGAWLVISRAGLQPLGFSDRIVELTAMHFHFAGFALPIIAGATASRLGRGPLIPAAVIVAIPFTALGITLAGTTEWIAATFMATIGLLVAFSVLALAQKTEGPAQALLGIAGVALIGGMALAYGWAWSKQFNWGYLDLDAMVATHGVLNGFGFSLLGLIGLCTMDDVDAPDQNRICMHIGRPSEKYLAEILAEAAGHDTTNPIGLLYGEVPAGFKQNVWRRPVEHGDFERASAGIQAWAGHQHAGIRRLPDRPAIAIGETLAMLIPVGPISVSATARVIEVIDDPDRYGFIYSTLPHHPEDGEESFVVSRDPNGDLEMVVTAMWRGAAVANHLLPPLTRFLQNRAIGRYLVGTVNFSPVRTADVEVART